MKSLLFHRAAATYMPGHDDCARNLMAAEFRLEIRGDVVLVVERGVPLFEETSKALAAAIQAAKEHGRKILFDHRLADLSNYYSYIVRHAESALAIGLDHTFRIALVGTPDQGDVMSFMVTVGRNRGWNSRCFLGFDEALQWLLEE
jgi:hypothetical protein